MWTSKHKHRQNPLNMYRKSEKVYQPLPENDDGDFDYETSEMNPKQRVCFSMKLGLAIIIVIFIIIILASILTTIRFTSKTGQQIYTSCGSTPAEAHRRNCHFDILSFAWQTPECYDHENTEAFRTHNNHNHNHNNHGNNNNNNSTSTTSSSSSSWTYYTSYHGNETRSEQEAITGLYETYVTAEYHFVHCTYMWRQLHRAYEVRGWVDDHVGGWNHTVHCQGVLLGGMGMGVGTERSVVNTVGVIRYPRCRRVW